MDQNQIKVYMTKENVNGKDVVIQHLSDPKELKNMTAVMNELREKAGGNGFYKWEPNLNHFNGKAITKATITKVVETTNQIKFVVEDIETINCFNAEEERTYEIVVGRGFGKKKEPVIFANVNDVNFFLNQELTAKVEKMCFEKFGTLPIIRVSSSKNFENHRHLKIIIHGVEVQTTEITPIKQKTKPSDGIYKVKKKDPNAENVTFNSHNFLKSNIGSMLNDADLKKIQDRVNKKK